MELRLREIDSKTQWEDFLSEHSPQALFQSWLWGEVQTASGQQLFRFGIFEKDTLVGIAQVFVIKAKRGRFLHIRHGPVWDAQKVEYWTEFLRIIKPIAKREHAWFIRMNPLLVSDTKSTELFRTLGFRNAPIHAMDAEYCWVLPLDASEDALLSGMRKTTRYEIKKAKNLGVTITSAASEDNLVKFYDLYNETSRRHGFVQHQGIGEEFRVFGRDNKALLYLASYESKVIAGAIILFYGNQAIYHHGASFTGKVSGSYLIQWEAIREAKKRGMKLYNFWGIAPDDRENHPWRGITLFKKGFGGHEVNYIHALDFAVSPFYIIPKSVESIRRKLRGYS